MSDIKLVIAIPTAGMVRMEFAYSLAGLMTRLAIENLPSHPKKTLYAAMSVASSSVIHANRENLVTGALSQNATHILFLDDDMEFDARAIDILFSRKKPVVVSNYLIKNREKDRFSAMAPDMQTRIPTLKSSVGVSPIGFAGFGVSLFDTTVFKKISQPWFLPQWSTVTSTKYTTEDYPFFEKLREAGIPCFVDHDASKMVRHLGNSSWSWEDYSGSIS